MRQFLCPIALCALATTAGAQPAQLVISSGPAQSFVTITQPQRDHAIQLDYRPVNPSAAEPQDTEWERLEPNDALFLQQRRIDWSATASCSDGIQTLRIEGPGGTQNQNVNGTQNAIAGRTLYESFEADALEEVCLDYARAATSACGELPTTEPGCETVRTFHFDEISPLPGSAPVRVSGTCTGGPVPPLERRPRLALTCRLVDN